MDRPDWDEYFIKIMEDVSARSTCDRGKTGCVFVKDKQILCSGYAGSIPGFEHCDEVGHLMENRTRFVTEAQVLEKGISTILLNEKGFVFDEYKKAYVSKTTSHCVRTIHAEQNAILQAARRGISLEGSTIYVTMTPCFNCAMSLISVGVKRIVCKKKYHAGEESESMFEQAGIEICFVENKIQEYPEQ